MGQHDAPLLVMVFAPPIGRPDHAPRVRIGAHAYRLVDALKNAAYLRTASKFRPAQKVWIARRGTRTWQHAPKPVPIAEHPARHCQRCGVQRRSEWDDSPICRACKRQAAKTED